MNSFITRRRCPCCFNKNFEKIYSEKLCEDKVYQFIKKIYKNRIERQFFGSAKYTLLRCKKCSLIFQEEILNQNNTERLYSEFINPSESFLKKKNSKITYFKLLSNNIFKITRCCSEIFDLNPKNINVLDFGMGWANWCISAKSYGLNVFGAELSQEKLKNAANNGIKTIDPFKEEYIDFFHYINTEQVFEHLTDPYEILENLTKTLKKKGIIKISVPPRSISYLKLLINKNNWRPQKDSFQPLEHINSFNKKSIILLTKKFSLIPLKPQNLYKNPIVILIFLLASFLGYSPKYFQKI
tara:strand:- start:713 stop:1606 length:894 start_codon:yes stop_codon:yes gene_type:complete